MNEGLDAALVLDTEGGKPSKQYRTSPYTVRDCALPYAQRVAVDAECDARAGIERTAYSDETSVKPYTVGRATQKLKGAQQAPFKSAQPAQLPATSPPLTAMTTAYVHPAPSPALHTLNTPEGIDHNEAHPDNLATYAAPAPRNVADLLDVVSRYVTLTENTDDTDWTHWGPSPFVRGDTHSFAINLAENVFKCFTSHKTGDVVDFIMFMEEVDEAGALAWFKQNFPGYYEGEPDPRSLDGSSCDYPCPRTAPVATEETAHSDFAFTPAGLPDPLAALANVVDVAAVPLAAVPLAHDSIVYETTNYDLFHLLPQNRAVNQTHVRLLVRQITARNLLHTQPLDVTADMGVVDGQHRLAAARELGVPVYYKIGQQLSEADITALNIARKNWAGTDYLHMHTVNGKPDYIALTAFMKRHPMLSFSNAKMMLGETNKGGIEEFRLGQWKAGQAYKAELVAEFIEAMAAKVPTFKQLTHTGFVAAVHHCVTNIEGFDTKEFMHKIQLNPRMLVPCASLKQFLQMFEEVYNFRTSDAKRLRF